MPAVADRLEKAGICAVTTTPAEFDKFFRDEADALDQGATRKAASSSTDRSIPEGLP